MQIEGKLSKWNDDRGFGFITPTQGGQDIFVHVSEFPRDGIRPALGEALSFEIELDGQGRKQARRVRRSQRGRVAQPLPARSHPPRIPRKSSISGAWIAVLVAAAVGGMYAYRGHFHLEAPAQAITDQPASAAADTARFQCDGRTHCSQMTSCAEATFFLRHCPNTKMDGNHDGVPCEQQWCTSPFAK